MKRFQLLLLLTAMAIILQAGNVRIYFTLEIQSDPDNAALCVRTGPLMDWEYLGKTPQTKTFYRDLDLTCFMKTKDYYMGRTVFYSDRYGYNHGWVSAGELFTQLRRDFGDKVIADLGVLATGALLAEYPGYDEALRVIELNGNVTSIYFDQAQAENNPNYIFLPLREQYNYYGYQPGYPRDTSIQISSDPLDAAVYCNEQYIGQTPCELNVSWWSAENRQEIRIEKSGYITNRRMITPEEYLIHVVLQPMY